MLAMLTSVVLVALTATVLLGALVGVTAVPFVLAVDMAERRGFSPARWGTVALLLCGLAGAFWLFALLAHSAVSLFWVLAAAFVGWLTVVVLALLSPSETRVGGYQGVHEA